MALGLIPCLTGGHAHHTVCAALLKFIEYSLQEALMWNAPKLGEKDTATLFWLKFPLVALRAGVQALGVGSYSHSEKVLSEIISEPHQISAAGRG